MAWDGGFSSYAPVPNGGSWVNHDAEGLRALVERWSVHPPFSRAPAAEPPLTEAEQRVQAFMDARLTRNT